MTETRTRRTAIWTSCLAVALGLCALPNRLRAQAHADSLPASVTLEQVLDLLDRRSVRVQADRSQIDVARSESVQAGIWPNPDLNYAGVYLAQGANTGALLAHQITVSQALLIGGQTGARGDFAELGVRAAKARFESNVVVLRVDAKRAFTVLLLRQEHARVLEAFNVDLARIEKIVLGRSTIGEASRYDALRIQLERRSLEARIASARADVSEASGNLGTLVGVPGWQPRAQGTLLSTAPAAVNQTALWEHARRKRPSIVAARREAAAAKSSISLAKRERFPVPVLALGTLLTQTANSGSVYAGLSIPLPIFDRKQGQLAKAEAQAKTAQLQLDATLRESKALLEKTVRVLDERRKALGRFESDVASRLPELRQMAESAYRDGRPIIELLDALRTERDARLNEVDLQFAVRDAEILAEFAAGLPDTRRVKAR